MTLKKTGAFWNVVYHLYVADIYYYMGAFLRAAYILIKLRDKRAPLRALGYMWLGVLVDLIAPVIIFSQFSPGASIAAEPVLQGMRSIFWAMIWTLYVFLSKRVKNTYCEDSLQSAVRDQVRRQAAIALGAGVMRSSSADGRDGVHDTPGDEEASVHELRIFKLPSSGRWYWDAKNRRGKLMARGGPLNTWVECAKQFHAGGHR